MRRILIILTFLALMILPVSRCQHLSRQQALYKYYFPIATYTANPKRGVGLTYPHCEDIQAMGASWQYNWSFAPVNCTGEDVPMVWGVPQMELLRRGRQIGGDSSWLMGFNEPDLSDQARMTPEEAAAAWHWLEAQYPGKLLISPAPSHLHPEWLPQFRAAYVVAYGRPPRLDALAMHCYYPTAEECITLAQRFVGWADEWDVTGGVWVTEFAFPACYCGGQVAGLREAQEFIAWMDLEPAIARYAWFSSRQQGNEWWSFRWAECRTPLFDFETGALTVWGQMYSGQ